MQVPVIIMVGLSASGKSTEAAYMAEKLGADVYNADKIREELYGDASIQGDNKEVFHLLYERAKDDVSIGRPVILDNTNITVKDRKRAMNVFRNYDVRFEAVYMDTDIEECKRRNAERERVVPEYVIDRMAERFEEPKLEEGFWSVSYIYDEELPYWEA